MQGILAAKPAKDSMITKLKYGVLLLLLGIGSCKRNSATELIPTGPVSLTIDLNLPSNQHLANVGGFSYFEGGVRGVVIIHDYDDVYYAFERTCAHLPLNTCSTIYIDTQSIQMKCGAYENGKFVPCCDSRYQFSGFPVKGPAKGRLANYKIQKNSNLLLVYN
jgi:Rieske Fe-S protein